ncbi:MAG: phosphoglycerate kinase [Candidatus Marinimicrobia bacterium]|jgi:3-phosphoglycerate kinase|nr:phosphoglycerate kinase [Candidatus Neomarinimicrobiota bacterium]MBT3501396.1 phosphoglycerate kinase [Candidatus Neomarinimicrobiota bacterium]MBT3839465.1 phosphoglycerate kinase [Candidatus Neomarinimicrobiota bacterium]MBT3998550.1 phosphoglycerate kinase [Candidatus Neomarinimicrobiota bacterium]MBT4283022.1 phosphoglycerate kinase [Candidatus Neomarinimicrobiota bacterium]
MIRTLKAFDLKGKNILIRVDFNVPMKNGKISNNFRIKAVLPTINTCLEGGASVVLMSHLGRPSGKVDPSLSLMPVGEELAGLLEMPIKFSDDCISNDAIDNSLSLKAGEVHLLENLRFHNGENLNDNYFASRLARHGQIFINDAFGTAHRYHASNVGVASHFKHAGIGWLMDKEINFLDRFMKKPNRPMTLILGGSKVSSKLGLIHQFMEKADHIIIGGGMAFTFLKANGKEVGGSLVDEDLIPTAKQILNLARTSQVRLHLPVDVFCGKSPSDTNPKGTFKINDIPADLMGLDIGIDTITKFKDIISLSQTIVWNGPLGVFEEKEYSMGTREIGFHLANCVDNGQKVIVGGGDTSAATEKYGLSKLMTHVSTGGGASLELLSGNQLPALKALDS